MLHFDLRGKGPYMRACSVIGCDCNAFVKIKSFHTVSDNTWVKHGYMFEAGTIFCHDHAIAFLETSLQYNHKVKTHEGIRVIEVTTLYALAADDKGRAGDYELQRLKGEINNVRNK